MIGYSQSLSSSSSSSLGAETRDASVVLEADTLEYSVSEGTPVVGAGNVVMLDGGALV
jgi:lipopolysaccharide export system protein LptA